METISLLPSSNINSLYVNERKNCTGGSVVLEDRYTTYFMQVTDTTNISIDSSLLDVPTNCSVQFKLVVWSDKTNVLNFTGCSIEQIEVRRGESVFTVQWTGGSNIWSVMPDVLSGYNEVPLKAPSRPDSPALASQKGLVASDSNGKNFEVFSVLNPYQVNNSSTSNWSYGANTHNNSTAYVWSIKPFMIRSLQLHWPANSEAKYFPSSFSVYGTNDGQTWTPIISNASTNYTAGVNEVVTVTGSNNFFKTFRFDFVQTNSESSYLPPISILGYEGNLINNRHFAWLFPAITTASGGYSASVDTTDLTGVTGDAYTLVCGTRFYAKNTTGSGWHFTYTLPEAQRICGLYFKVKTTNGSAANAIGTVEIYGSNDSGTTWTLLSELDSNALYGGAPGDRQDYTYLFDSQTAYSQYKISVLTAYNNSFVDGGISFSLEQMNLLTTEIDINEGFDSIIPVMSSNSQDGYVVSVSNTAGSTSAYMMFDGSAGTYCDGTFNNGEWVVNIQLPTATAINGIRMISRSSGYDCTPYAFTVQGSNDNNTWDVLTTVNVGSSYWNAGGKVGIFTFENSTAYTYYRVVYTASAQGTYAVIAELGITSDAYMPSVNWIEEVYIVPVMTSDSQDGYVASASSYFPSHLPYYAFDRNNTSSNKWLTATNDVSGSWLKIELPTARSVSLFTIQTPNESAEVYRVPKTFKIQGSNDDSSWTDLVEVNNVSWTNNEIKSWTNSSTTAYQYYRVLVSANGGAANVAIGTWNLIEQIIHTN